MPRSIYDCLNLKCIGEENENYHDTNDLLQVEQTYNGALDTELAEAMYECDADVSQYMILNNFLNSFLNNKSNNNVFAVAY